jgi:hypothetical protein
MTIETRPDFCLTPHLSQMLSYGCTRLEIGLQVRGGGLGASGFGLQQFVESVGLACAARTCTAAGSGGLASGAQSLLCCRQLPVSQPVLPLTPCLPSALLCPPCTAPLLQSTYEDVARDTNRGHTVAAVGECFQLAKDAGFKVGGWRLHR